MKERYLSVEGLDAYALSFELSNYVWKIIIHWSYFEKDTVGKQFVRAIDSISANIAEGFGRFSKKDKIRFYYYSLGSVLECKDWNNKCHNRSIIKTEEFIYIKSKLDRLPKEIYQLIQFTNTKLKY
ncbi:MAG: four helix bundle protein [Bacteroidetes bacterium]|nr:MAG: four helix bundle protein [Bacteroidota bacterium]RLD79988.1 MAG: four helix bundle protein [Bacteroidota bacterium]